MNEVKCPKCGSEKKSIGARLQYICNECGYNYEWSKCQMKKYKCQYCSKSYQSYKDLDRHLQKIHGLKPTKFKKSTKEEQSEFINQCLKLMDKIDDENL